ncbi:hypothetical protein SPI_07731 [Niveomyces insectorum RCEF 264]|uniref:Uncharacterized protein n=1 Tax=Niveomyces insectorum RCEF 264 TaxID=1081102 RepID=A0A167PJL9_9HYPO|nr:hypothetical protein SPI_07731 [Niveomyces insectorum RCEF 264]
MVVGPALPAELANSDNLKQVCYRHIRCLPANIPTPVHYYVTPHGIRKLATKQADPPSLRRIPLHWIPSPSVYQYFVSAVYLDNVARVTPLFKRHKCLNGSFFMCGPQFEYEDGARPVPVCLGEFRIDDGGKPNDVHGAKAFYLGYFGDGSAAAHLTEVVLSPQVGTHTMTCIRIPLKRWCRDLV